MKSSAIAPILLAIICPLSLSLTACDNYDDCGSKSYGIFGGVSTLCDYPHKERDEDMFEKYDLPVTPSYVGEDFTDYENLQPKEYELSTQLYKLLAQLPYHERAFVPLYRVEVDKKRLTETAAKIAESHSMQQVFGESESKVYVYKGDSKSLIADAEKGLLTFTDAKLRDDHSGVVDVDKRAILEGAQRFFETYLSHQDMESSYYYKYSTKVEKEAETDTDVVTRASVTINRVLDGIPVLGDKGKSSVEVKPDGGIVKYELSFVKYISTGETRSVFETDRIEAKLVSNLQMEGVSLTSHMIRRAEFGYGNIKDYHADLVPVFRYIIDPQEGVSDVRRTYELKGFDTYRNFDEGRERDRKREKISE